MTGIELISKERQEQIDKHGYTKEHDKRMNEYSQLSYAATLLADEYPHEHEREPSEWDAKIWRKMINKPYKERLIIAGALIAAEIDRINTG